MVISIDAEKAFVLSQHEHVTSPHGLPQCVQSLRLNDLKTKISPKDLALSLVQCANISSLHHPLDFLPSCFGELIQKGTRIV